MCTSCKKLHNDKGIPPSLQGKLSTCSECYKTMKAKCDAKWVKSHRYIVNKKRQAKRKADPIATRIEWLDRRKRWRASRLLIKKEAGR
jgi:hypothetical protein